jgi:hypothetical protein
VLLVVAALALAGDRIGQRIQPAGQHPGEIEDLSVTPVPALVPSAAMVSCAGLRRMTCCFPLG